MSFSETPVMQNARVRLEPLGMSHAADLTEEIGDLWRTWYLTLPTPEKVPAEIESRLAKQRAGTMAPWAIVDPRDGRAIGMTAYAELDEPNRRLQIGYTWLASRTQGTGVNPAAKRLLLARAFDDLDCIAVEFRTHFHNRQSRAAIERLGAKQDGILRSHRILPDGHVRDTVVYSILATEWPAVRTGLDARLA